MQVDQKDFWRVSKQHTVDFPAFCVSEISVHREFGSSAACAIIFLGIHELCTDEHDLRWTRGFFFAFYTQRVRQVSFESPNQKREEHSGGEEWGTNVPRRRGVHNRETTHAAFGEVISSNYFQVECHETKPKFDVVGTLDFPSYCLYIVHTGWSLCRCGNLAGVPVKFYGFFILPKFLQTMRLQKFVLKS